MIPSEGQLEQFREAGFFLTEPLRVEQDASIRESGERDGISLEGRNFISTIDEKSAAGRELCTSVGLMERAKAYTQERGQPVLLTEWGFPTWGGRGFGGSLDVGRRATGLFQGVPAAVDGVADRVFLLRSDDGVRSVLADESAETEWRPASEFMEGVLKSA